MSEMVEDKNSVKVRNGGLNRDIKERSRIRPESFADHYSHARQFYLSQTSYEQAHIASALVFELSKVEHIHIRKAIVGHLLNIEEDLAKRVAVGLALDEMPDAPVTAAPVQEMDISPALQIIGKMKDTLMGRTVAILIADGSMLAADGQLAGMPSVLFDAVAVILSDDGVDTLSMENAAIDFVRDAFGHLKAIALDAGGQELLRIANVEEDAGVVDANDTDAFIAAAKTRQWDRERSVRTLA